MTARGNPDVNLPELQTLKHNVSLHFIYREAYCRKLLGVVLYEFRQNIRGDRRSDGKRERTVNSTLFLSHKLKQAFRFVQCLFCLRYYLRPDHRRDNRFVCALKYTHTKL